MVVSYCYVIKMRLNCLSILQVSIYQDTVLNLSQVSFFIKILTS